MKRLALLVLLAVVLVGCEGRSSRAQAAADARAGLQAVEAVGGVPPAAAAILRGVDARLPAASGVNSSEWPAPTMPPAAIASDPGRFAATAPPEPAPWSAGVWAGLCAAGVAGLGLLRVVAPLVPGGGPVMKWAADLAWAAMAHPDQKAEDAAHRGVALAAARVAPLVGGLRSPDLDPFVAGAITYLEHHAPPLIDCNRTVAPYPDHGPALAVVPTLPSADPRSGLTEQKNNVG